MATQLVISCIKRAGNVNAHEHITEIGGVHNGNRWEITVPGAVARIEAGTHQFVVTQGHTSIEVVVVTMSNGTKYLRTKKDNTLMDNLLSLPTCP